MEKKANALSPKIAFVFMGHRFLYIEPLPPEHPFRHLPNVLATPHLGYGSKSLYATFYRDSVENIKSWILKNRAP